MLTAVSKAMTDARILLRHEYAAETNLRGSYKTHRFDALKAAMESLSRAIEHVSEAQLAEKSFSEFANTMTPAKAE